MQEEVTQKTVTFCIRATKITADLLKKVLVAYLRHQKQKSVEKKAQKNQPKQGKVTVKELAKQNAGMVNIEITNKNIKSFERYARKHQVRYHIEKELGTDPPKWTVYFKANQADALTAAFKEYTKKDLTRSTRPSLLIQLHKFKELAQSLGRDRVKNKEHGGPER